MAESTVERTREEVRERRRREHLAQARRLRDCSPGETIEAAFDLTSFAREIHQGEPRPPRAGLDPRSKTTASDHGLG